MKNVATAMAELKAIESIVSNHAAAMSNPQTTLERSLGDYHTAQALFAIDPKGLSEAVANIEDTDRENLHHIVDSLIDLGSGDDVTRALKNTTLLAVQKNTGVRPARTNSAGAGAAKIAVGGNKSPVRFNGVAVKRSPVKSFNDVVDAPTKTFNQVVSDAVNINAGARSIIREAIARKAADGRLHNSTDAASTLRTNSIGKRKEMNTQDYDNEETWTDYAKREAAGRVKGDSIPSQKSVEIPSIRMDSFNDTNARLPFEFRSVNSSDMATRLTQGVVDVVNPNGSAHGPIHFNTEGTGAPVTYDQGKATYPQYRGGKAKNGEPQQFPRKPTGDAGGNIESGREYY